MTRQKNIHQNIPIEIAGAGPAGLAAALTIAKRGGRAIVYERRSEVGSRFHGDLQGLENWTTEGDVLDELASIGIETNFSATPFREVVLFGPDGQEHIYRSAKPMAYIVHRGSAPGTLDSGLKQQALDAGVEIRFAESRDHLLGGGIVAGGPHGADAIGVGYLFDTDMEDGAYVALSNKLAPQGYAYLLIQGGHGTLMSWMYADFHNEQHYLEQSLEFFQTRVGVDMKDPRRTGGAANFLFPRSARQDKLLYTGEAAGFQDALWGFGMRYAMLSGHLAARSLLTGEDYDRLWRKRLGGLLRAALVNRYIYRRLGDRGYELLLGRIDQALRFKQDGRGWLHRYTARRLWKRLCFPLVQRALPSHRPSHNVPVEGCDCTWCRCR
ncbi:MAG: NAD(P)/FAD-dependent oxidoreductase [Gammaproteobacteria bacterium]|nr:MAG: NAD(P)/FAD-dependent oxidoreductase [Gammaproteobacteria bacterium]